MESNNYKITWPESNCSYSHSTTYSVVCNENGKTIINNTPICVDDCGYSICYDDIPSIIDTLSIQPKKVIIHFNDKETAEYNNACDLQDFLNQVNNYHDLQEAFNTVVNKLLEVKPELNEWVEINFKKYLTTKKL